MKLQPGDEVVNMLTENQGTHVLCISENGLGKLTPMTEFRTQRRGGYGIKCYRVTERTGKVIGAKMVIEENEVLVITTEGIMIRMPVSDISMLGRITMGVKVMNLTEGVTVASLTKVKNDDRTQEEIDAEEERIRAESIRYGLVDPEEDSEEETDIEKGDEAGMPDDIEELLERAYEDAESEDDDQE